MSEETTAVASQQAPSPTGCATPTRTRKLQRIVDGQQVAGVCTGIAAYAELRVDWVRTFFVLATVFTAGIFGLVYVALAVILPVDHSRDIDPGQQGH